MKEIYEKHWQKSYLVGKPLDNKYLLQKLKTNYVIMFQNSFHKFMISNMISANASCKFIS